MNTIHSYFKRILPGQLLKEGYDFDVVSFLVFDLEDMEFYSCDQYYKNSTHRVVESQTEGKIAKEKVEQFLNRMGIEQPELQPTDMEVNEQLIFYQLYDGIDFNLAMALGFGIVRMKTGKYKGQYFMYYAHTADMDQDEEDRRFKEVLMLKIYCQIKYADRLHDPMLKYFVVENPHYILYSLIFNEMIVTDELIEKLNL